MNADSRRSELLSARGHAAALLAGLVTRCREVQLRGQVRSQVQLGNEGDAGSAGSEANEAEVAWRTWTWL